MPIDHQSSAIGFAVQSCFQSWQAKRQKLTGKRLSCELLRSYQHKIKFIVSLIFLLASEERS